MSIDDAAQAFQNDMNGGTPVRDAGKKPVEDIFSNSATHESDLTAGGDDLPLGEKPRRAKPEPEAESDEDELVNEFGIEGEEGDEDEDPEAEAEEGDDDEDDDDDEGEAAGLPKSVLEKKVTVMVDGEEQEISVKEAIEGGIRTKTFHKRLNQLDGVKQELAGHAERVITDRKRADEIMAEAEELIAGILPAEPDWDKLFAEDPKTARELQKQYDGYKGKIAEIREKRAKLQREQADKDAAELTAYSRKEFPKFAAIAKWRNKEDMQKDLGSMRKTALNLGFSEEEVAQVHDSRMLTILLKASKYDRMMAARPKAVKNGKTPVNPGAGRKSTAQRGVIGAQKKLARTGSVEDAAAVFGQIIRR